MRAITEAMKVLIFLVAIMATGTIGSQVTSDYCYPGASCWPSNQKLVDLMNSLDGEIYFQHQSEYTAIVVLKDTAYVSFPAFIALVKSTEDIQKCLKFAHDSNIKVTIQSSGHDYIGRSSATGSMQINLRNMTNIAINLNSSRNPAGVVTVESGNNWLRVYKQMDKYNRIIVGGSGQTVAMGGYTLGGGHSPFSRLHGLAVDNLLDVTMVTANGTIVMANASMTKTIDHMGMEAMSSNTDLFWALRGGGGGTFGIVTNFTFRLHMAPAAVQRMECNFALYDGASLIGIPFWQKWNDLLATSLAPEWGGYAIYSGAPIANTSYNGLVKLVLNHMGAYNSTSYNTITPMTSFFKQMAGFDLCSVKMYSRFLEYELTAIDAVYYNSYLINILTQPNTWNQDFYSTILTDLMTKHSDVSGFGCTATSLGGKVKDVGPDDTPLNSGWRTATSSLSCGIGFSGLEFDKHHQIADELAKKLLTFGKGSYLNEASEYLPDWKTAYWGSHYDRLLRIKREWDPSNVFSCHHCVGSDIMTPGGSSSIIG